MPIPQKFYLVKKSANKKTGNISQVYTDKENSCPAHSCVFKGCNGCYADNCCCKFTWNKCYMTIEELAEALKDPKVSHVIRHNVAGDIARPGTDLIDSELLEALCECYKDKAAYTYTHTALVPENIAEIKKALDKGFVINKSCESLKQIEICLNNNIPCVLAVENMAEEEKEVNGITFKKCNGDCVNCGWCMTASRDFVPVFVAHGSGRAKIIKAQVLIKNL